MTESILTFLSMCTRDGRKVCASLDAHDGPCTVGVVHVGGTRCVTATADNTRIGGIDGIDMIDGIGVIG